MLARASQSSATDDVLPAILAVESRRSLDGREIVVGRGAAESTHNTRPTLTAQWHLDPEGRLVCQWTKC
jgi:hypothetical protein